MRKTALGLAYFPNNGLCMCVAYMLCNEDFTFYWQSEDLLLVFIILKGCLSVRTYL